MSKKSRKGSLIAIETIGHGAEAFLFTYLGLSISGIHEDKFSISFSFMVLLGGIVARAVSVFVPLGLVYLCSSCKAPKLSLRSFAIIWYSGIIRGAIAFALSL